MGEPQTARVVVIDDDPAMRISCQKILSKSGYAVETFENGAQGLEGVARLKPDLLLVDLKMPGLTGTEVIARVQEFDPGIVIVVITGYATIDTAVSAMKCGAYDFLPKPFSPDELRIIVNRGLERRRFIVQARQAEVERELLKRRFVTFVSHQLQTPLVAVHQYLDVLRQLEGSPDAAVKRAEWMDRCLKRVREMQSLIRDWLTLARLECGALARERTRVDVGAVAAAVAATLEDAARDAHVEILNEIPGGQYFVPGDQTCMSVLLDNLAGNAVKYNRPGGSVTLRAQHAGSEVLISVQDTGIGIPEKYQALLFEEFFRVEQSGPNRKPGSGLGLAICRRIVNELGGAVHVSSREGCGSTFTVRLPAWQDASAAEA